MCFVAMVVQYVRAKTERSGNDLSLVRVRPVLGLSASEGKIVKKKHLPFGRMSEYLATLTDDERGRTAIKAGRSLGDNDTAQTWNHRKAMAKTIRMQERGAPSSEWRPVVKLTDGEGY